MPDGLLQLLDEPTAAIDLAERAGTIVPSVVVTSDEAIDSIQVAMMAMPAADCPVVHQFTPGLYTRQIFMPAGAIVTSKIHKTEHPYVITSGRVSVWIDGAGWQELCAPHFGITKPGTRRVLVIHEDTVWTTFHPTKLTDVDAIEDEIIEPRYEHLKGLAQPTSREILDRVEATLPGSKS